MNELIKNLLQSIVSDYDDGVFYYEYYPVNEIHEINTEDLAAARLCLEDIGQKLCEIQNKQGDGTLDIHCVFQKRISRIYIHYNE